jgi:two-component system NtrC family sensor kinase
MTDSAQRHILLVEDSRTQAARAQLVLRDAGYRVTIARDGEAAWQCISAEWFDIIVSDINMPGIDGYELCRRSKAEQRLRAIPFVLLTAQEDLEALVRGFEAGADDFITKPWMPSALQGRIAAVLQDPDRTGRGAKGASVERMTRLLLGRTVELEHAYRELGMHEAQLLTANEALAGERSALEVANKQLGAASLAKSEFLANMSHELRTPLNAILGFSDLLLNRPDGTYDRDSQVKFLTYVHGAGEHLLALINDILDLAKVEAGQMVLRPGPVDLADLIGEIMATVAPLAGDKGIDLVNRATAGELTADPGKLKQIVYNLLSNAIKFTPGGGRVEVRADWSALEVAISFSDTGVGMSADELGHLFQEFWQSERPTDEASRGTGLGLALTKKLVELHGGRVTVTSELGVGSTFTVRLPLRKSALELLKHPSDDAVGDKPLVLVAEDDKATATLLARWIRSAGYRVNLVRSGAEVLESARSLRPRFVTLDVLMPNTDGWSALTALKQDPETAGIPVIVVTIVDAPDIAAAKGADAYILKPVTRESILGALARFEPPPNAGDYQLGTPPS